MIKKDDFLEAYFGKVIKEKKEDQIDSTPRCSQIKYQDTFKIFKMDQNGNKEDY
jgi:hypothetical protein